LIHWSIHNSTGTYLVAWTLKKTTPTANRRKFTTQKASRSASAWKIKRWFWTWRKHYQTQTVKTNAKST
jgi:hypothetical protein